jgi:hypothetical protein
MIMRPLELFVALSFSFPGCTFAADARDPGYSALMKENIELRRKLEKAEETRLHLLQVLDVLRFMPDSERKILSLQQMTFDKDGRIDLRPMAKADLSKGRFIFLETGGLPALGPKGLADFHKRMKEKYGLTYVVFGTGCDTEKSVCESVDRYNATVREAMRKNHPAFDEQKEYEAFAAEWTRATKE